MSLKIIERNSTIPKNKLRLFGLPLPLYIYEEIIATI